MKCKYKIFSIFLTIVFLLSFNGCSIQQKNNEKQTDLKRNLTTMQSKINSEMNLIYQKIDYNSINTSSDEKVKIHLPEYVKFIGMASQPNYASNEVQTTTYQSFISYLNYCLKINQQNLKYCNKLPSSIKPQTSKLFKKINQVLKQIRYNVSIISNDNVYQKSSIEKSLFHHNKYGNNNSDILRQIYIYYKRLNHAYNQAI